jgi:hypothetical protein
MTRNGKIARLPWKIREEVNHRLRDNVSGGAICKWLNGLPAAKTVCEEFARRRGCAESPITPNQLSEWRRGGFQDWLREQQVLKSTREMARWSAKLAKDSGGELSEGAAVLLGGQLLKLLQGMALFQNIQVPSSKFQVYSPEHDTPSDDELAESSSASQDFKSQMQGESLRIADVADSRSGTGEMEQLERAVGLLGQLVKSLSGIRNGDHRRVQLAQAEKKLALRSEVVAMAREKHDEERAERKELERQRRAQARRKKRDCGLSDPGKIDWVRGETFGRERIIKEKEAEMLKAKNELLEVQKDLEILKAQWDIEQSAPNGVPVEPAEAGTTNGAAAEPAEAGTSNGAPSGRESIRVHASAYDQSAGKNIGNGEPGPDSSTHPSSLRYDETSPPSSVAKPSCPVQK